MGICYNLNNNEKENEIAPTINRNHIIDNNKNIVFEKLCYCCKDLNLSISYFFPDYNKDIDNKKLTKLKKKVLKRQKELRAGIKIQSPRNNLNNHSLENNMIDNMIDNNKINESKKEDEVNEKINHVLEDMCIYGNIAKEEIKIEKEKNPENFIEINDALNLEEEDKDLFALALLGDNLQQNGIEVAIDKTNPENENEEEIDDNTTCLQFITNGMNQKKKYNLHFDFGEEKNEEYLSNEKKFEELKENLKKKLSKDYNISKDKIIVTFPERGSLKVQVIFQSDEFNNLEPEEFKSKFENDDEYEELKNLKEVHNEVIMSACKLKKSQLDPEGNRFDNWGINENRGNRPYNPPLGWIGIGLKVLDQYDNGDNTWIGMDNSEGEWCVAYHGVGSNQKTDEVKNITGAIIKGGFKKGWRQAHSLCNDQYHQGKQVGEGVYCTPNINTAGFYAGISKINEKSYKTVLMVRVKPDAIRGCTCEGSEDYWVVNGTTDEIRPYRILYKVKE